MRTALLSILVSLSVAGPVVAGENSVSATIPFAFTAADEQMNSGEYLFEMKVDAGQLSIKARRGGPLTLRARNLPYTGDLAEDAQRYEIVLNRYEDEYYLSQVWMKQYGMEVSRSDAEKARTEKGEQPKVVKLKLKPRG